MEAADGVDSSNVCNYGIEVESNTTPYYVYIPFTVPGSKKTVKWRFQFCGVIIGQLRRNYGDGAERRQVQQSVLVS